MSIIDINNPPSAPDSDLDSDLSNQHLFTIADSALEEIAPGDWVDVDPSALPPDPNWGMSFQVVNVYPNENVGLQAVGILITSDGGQTYSETQLSASWVTNNFRRVPNSQL